MIERLLGRGGMGAVFAAREPRLDRRVALKVLLPQGHESQEALARFEREARAAAALQSDHVARVYGVGHAADGSPYIAMELLDGEDLAAVLARRGPLPAGDVLALMLQATEALVEAHGRGIVHRDLKPANLFLARRPTGATTLKVLDFGISKAQAGAGAPLTATQAFLGTPLYMSPEQVRDVRAVDARTDLWALGVVMYELLTGKPPFLADTLPDVMDRILHASVAPLCPARPEVPRALEAVVLRCLEKDPARRFTSAQELAEALARTSFPGTLALSDPRPVSPKAASLGGGAPRAAAPPSAFDATAPAGSLPPPTPALAVPELVVPELTVPMAPARAATPFRADPVPVAAVEAASVVATRAARARRWALLPVSLGLVGAAIVGAQITVSANRAPAAGAATTTSAAPLVADKSASLAEGAASPGARAAELAATPSAVAASPLAPGRPTAKPAPLGAPAPATPSAQALLAPSTADPSPHAPPQVSPRAPLLPPPAGQAPSTSAPGALMPATRH